MLVAGCSECELSREVGRMMTGRVLVVALVVALLVVGVVQAVRRSK